MNLDRQKAKELLHSMEEYLVAVESIRAHHTGVAMLESAVKLCREKYEAGAPNMELYAQFWIAMQIYNKLHLDVLRLTEAHSG